MFVKNTTGSIVVKKRSDSQYIPETLKRKYQHEISNWIKKHAKTNLDKGPEIVDVTISKNLVILSISNYLTKYEKFVIETMSNSKESIKKSRLFVDMAVIQDGTVNHYIESSLNVKVLGHMFEAVVEEDFSLWIVLLDTHLTQ
ncbi:MAG: Na-translocating system protein MpsC family protein [Lachnospirales bacterium]